MTPEEKATLNALGDHNLAHYRIEKDIQDQINALSKKVDDGFKQVNDQLSKLGGTPISTEDQASLGWLTKVLKAIFNK